MKISSIFACVALAGKANATFTLNTRRKFFPRTFICTGLTFTILVKPAKPDDKSYYVVEKIPFTKTTNKELEVVEIEASKQNNDTKEDNKSTGKRFRF